MTRVRGTVIVIAILALAGGGCGNDNDASTGTPQADTHFTKDELKRFSIKRADLPADYKKTRSTSGTGDDCLPSQTGEEATVIRACVRWDCRRALVRPIETKFATATARSATRSSLGVLAFETPVARPRRCR